MKEVALNYLQTYVITLVFLGWVFSSIKKFKKSWSFWSWFFALIPVICSIVLLKTIYDEPPLWTALKHYETVQSLETTVTTGRNNLSLNFNHPVKELVWCAQRSDLTNAVAARPLPNPNT